MRKLHILFLLSLVAVITPVSADDAIRVYPPLTIPNQIVLENKPNIVYIVAFVGTYSQGATSVNPVNASFDANATKTYTLFDPQGNIVASGTLTFNESLSAYYAEISPTMFDEPGSWKINITIEADVNGDNVAEVGFAENELKVVHNKGAFLLLSPKGINKIKLTNGFLKVESVTNDTLALVDDSGRRINLTPNQSISVSIAGFPAAIIFDGVEVIDGETYAAVTVTYPNFQLSYEDFVEIPKRDLNTNYLGESSLLFKLKKSVNHAKYQPIVTLSSSSNSFTAELSKGDAIEFTQLLESKLFGLVQKFQEFRVEAPESVEWFVRIRAGISFSNWAAAGFPLSINEALDALLVWESTPNVKVNWKAEKWEQLLIFARKLAEKAQNGVAMITNGMIEPHWGDLGFKGGFWTKLFAEHSDEAVSAFVIAADWSIDNIQGIRFNWDEMWNALLNGEIIVSMDFIIEKVTLKFTA